MKMLRFVIYCVFVLAAGYANGAEQLRIAFLSSFSGTDPNSSNEVYRGAEIFLEEFSKEKLPFTIEKFDNQGTIQGTIARLQEIKGKGIKVVVGLTNSDEAIAASKFTEENGMLLISVFASNPEVTANKKNVFRMCFNDEQQGEELAKFIVKKFKFKNIVTLRNKMSKYSSGLNDVVAKNMKKLKTDYVNTTIDYTPEDFNPSKLSDEVASKNPDIVFMPDHINRAAAFLEAMSKKNLKTIYVGGDGFGGKKIFMTVMGSKKNVNVFYSHHWVEEDKNPVNVKFVKAYRKQFQDQSPTAGAALGYESLVLLQKAMKGFKVDKDVNVSELSKRIKGTSIQSTTGPFAFSNKNDNTPVRPVVFINYKNGVFSTAK